MQDEQIERVLEEARHAYRVSQVMRPFYVYQRMLERLIPQMDLEECTAALVMLRLALNGANISQDTKTAVLVLMREHIRSDGLCYPPSFEAISRRLGLTPVAVGNAFTSLVADGFIEEVKPKGIIFRRRRFRFIPAGGDVPSESPPT
jgi:DNA-binding transcriptional ArsR family regulator